MTEKRIKVHEAPGKPEFTIFGISHPVPIEKTQVGYLRFKDFILQHKTDYFDLIQLKGSAYPHLKDKLDKYDMVLFERDFLNFRVIPKLDNIRYLDIDLDPFEHKAWANFLINSRMDKTPDEPIRIDKKEYSDRNQILYSLRDAFMAERIKRIIEKHPDKKICVVVGDNHVDAINSFLNNPEKRKKIFSYKLIIAQHGKEDIEFDYTKNINDFSDTREAPENISDILKCAGIPETDWHKSVKKARQ